MPGHVRCQSSVLFSPSWGSSLLHRCCRVAGPHPPRPRFASARSPSPCRGGIAVSASRITHFTKLVLDWNARPNAPAGRRCHRDGRQPAPGYIASSRVRSIKASAAMSNAPNCSYFRRRFSGGSWNATNDERCQVFPPGFTSRTYSSPVDRSRTMSRARTGISLKALVALTASSRTSGSLALVISTSRGLPSCPVLALCAVRLLARSWISPKGSRGAR